MKAYRIAVILTATLMVVAGVGIGIAQAGGNHSERPAWSIDEQTETGNLPEATVDAQSIENSVPEGSYSGNDWQVAEAVEVGSVPDTSYVGDLDHTNIPSEGNINQYWGAENPSN